MPGQEHFDFVVQDYVIVRLIDFFLLLFVQIVVPETKIKTKIKSFLNQQFNTNLIF